MYCLTVFGSDSTKSGVLMGLDFDLILCISLVEVTSGSGQPTAPYLETCLRNNAPSLKRGSGTMVTGIEALKSLHAKRTVGSVWHHSKPIISVVTTLTQYNKKRCASLHQIANL